MSAIAVELEWVTPVMIAISIAASMLIVLCPRETLAQNAFDVTWSTRTVQEYLERSRSQEDSPDSLSQPASGEIEGIEAAARNKYHDAVEVAKTPTHTLFNSTIERLDPDLFDSRQRQLRADALAEDARKLAARQSNREGDSVDPRSFLRLGPPTEASSLLRPHPGLCTACQQTVKALKLARQKVKHQRAAQQLRVSQVRTALQKQDSELQELLDRLQSLRAKTKLKQKEVSKALVEAGAHIEAESQLISAAVEEQEHEKRRAAGLPDADDIDSSPTDWDDGGGILAATSAMLAKAPSKYKTASPKSSPRAQLVLSDREQMEARDQQLVERKKALRTRQLELGRLQSLWDVRLRGPATSQPDPVSQQGSRRSTPACAVNGALNEAFSHAKEESEIELEEADTQTQARLTALATLDTCWDEWRKWRLAKLHSELGKRAGPGSEPRALRLMLQREGADLDECTLLLPREHHRPLALKDELAAREAELVTGKTRRSTEARASLLVQRKQARALVKEHPRGDGETNRNARKVGIASPAAGSIKVEVNPQPQAEPEPQSEPVSTSAPLATASPADVEKLMRHGRHADAMKAMQSLIKGRGSLNFARAVARAAAGVGEGHPIGSHGGATEGMAGAQTPSWLKPAPKDWGELRREENKRKQLHQTTRGGIPWKKLIDTQGADVPYAATTRVQYNGTKEKAGTAVAEEESMPGNGLGMTQSLADAAGGLSPDVLEHLSAVW